MEDLIISTVVVHKVTLSELAFAVAILKHRKMRISKSAIIEIIKQGMRDAVKTEEPNQIFGFAALELPSNEYPKYGSDYNPLYKELYLNGIISYDEYFENITPESQTED